MGEISTKVLNQIKKKVNPGQTVSYIERNNKLNAKTIIDLENELDKAIYDEKNWKTILEAIYSVHGKSLVVAPKKKGKNDEFTVLDTKNTTEAAFDVTMEIKNNTLTIKNLMDANQETKIELGSVLDSTTESDTKESMYQTLVKELPDFKSKGPVELKKFLMFIVSNL